MTTLAQTSARRAMRLLKVPGFVDCWGIAQRIQIGFAVGAVVVVIVSLVAAFMVRLMSDTVGNMVDQVRVEQSTAASMKDAVSDENQGVQGFLITGDATFLGVFNTAHERFLDHAGQLRTSTLSSADRATAADVIALEASFRTLAQQEIDLSQAGFPNAAAFHWQTEGQQAEQQLRTRLDSFVAQRDRALSSTLASARRNEQIARAVFAPIVMLIAGFGLFTTLLTGRNIRQRFENLSAIVSRIERGDFNIDADVTRQDELGRLAVSIRDMARALERETRERDRLLEERERRNEELSALYDVARTVNQSLDTNDVLKLALEKLVAQTGSEAGVALLRDADTSRFRLALTDGLSEEEQAYAAGFWEEESAQEFAAAAQDGDIERIEVEALGIHRRRFRTALVVPLGARGAGRGLLFLLSSSVPAINADRMRLVEGLAKQVGVALEHAWLYGQSRRLAVVEERNRLARELHDSVSQSLFSMSMIAQALPSLIKRNPARADERAQRLGELARGALAEMRMLILELRPAALQELGLVAALERYVAGFGSREGLEASFLVEGLQRRLPHEQEEALFRVAQEALSNVVRHAQANSADVVLEFEPDSVGLTVRDDGVGLLGRNPAGGFGMTSMRERAEQLQGIFTIVSEPGHGVQVAVRLPAPAATTSIAG